MNESFPANMAKESEGLGPLVFSYGVIGYHEDINGPGATLFNFKPTRAELMTLAHHYLERYFSVQESFAMGCSGSFEIREAPFAWRRFESIADALSPGKPIREFLDFIEKRSEEVELIRKEFELRNFMEEEASDWE